MTPSLKELESREDTMQPGDTSHKIKFDNASNAKGMDTKPNSAPGKLPVGTVHKSMKRNRVLREKASALNAPANTRLGTVSAPDGSRNTNG